MSVIGKQRRNAKRLDQRPEGHMKGNIMIKIAIELPEFIEVATGETGKSVRVDLKAIAANPQVLRFAALNGFIGALNNVSRGKAEDGSANSDDVWHGMRQKRADVWLTGEWAGKGGGGERQTTGLKDAFIAERMAAGATSAQVEKAIKDAVRAAFGDKEPATFSRFMDALALVIAERDGLKGDAEAVAERRTKIEAKYKGLADAAAAARAKAANAIDLTGIDI